jgi:two-component system, NarL family, invasion response regulator UvrY
VTSTPRRRVLIADNNADLVAVLSELIRMDGGLELAGDVTTGAAAIERVTREPIDVLLLDLGLEDCHGFEVLDKLVRAGCPTRVIVHTGHSSPELQAHAKRRGAAAYVVKTGDIEELLAVMRAV